MEEFHKLALLSNNMPMSHICEKQEVAKNIITLRYERTLLVLIKGTQELCMF